MTVSLNSTKAHLRQQICERLNGMTSRRRAAASLQICSRLQQQAVWKSAGSILFFAPLPAEPEIWPLLEEALASGKTVALPRFAAASQTYVAARVWDLQNDIGIGHFQIREPVARCDEVPLNRFDLILVPGVAFDLQGRRLGRGKGYYDRLLADVRGVKCGVAFDEQIVDAIPVGPRDIHLDCLLTPTRWVKAEQNSKLKFQSSRETPNSKFQNPG